MRLEYIGLYSPEGQFVPLSKLNRWYAKNGTSNYEPALNRMGMRPEEIPPFIKLRPVERIVEDYPASYHAQKPMRGQSHLGGILNSLVTFAYGNERPLLSPQHVTTDSRGRAIIADPKVPGIHVLDGSKSFRIVGGPNRRMQNPDGVAVDGNDNIYVSDTTLGLILVYDPFGRYLRSIGQIDENETMFHQPSGIAIDRKQGRLYVADSLRNRIFVFDLKGNPLYRIGVPNVEQPSATFDFPTEVAVTDHEIVVLDQRGSRVQVTDLEGKLRGSFHVALTPRDPQQMSERGLAVDEAHIYVTNLQSATVTIYSKEGKLLGKFGKPAATVDLKSPHGLWVDTDSRIFVADAGTREIQVFRISMEPGAGTSD